MFNPNLTVIGSVDESSIQHRIQDGERKIRDVENGAQASFLHGGNNASNDIRQVVKSIALRDGSIEGRKGFFLIEQDDWKVCNEVEKRVEGGVSNAWLGGSDHLQFIELMDRTSLRESRRNVLILFGLWRRHWKQV